MVAAAKIVDQVGHDVRSAGLPRELKVLAREHVPIETKPQLHRINFCRGAEFAEENTNHANRSATISEIVFHPFCDLCASA